jgi:hypothetical protein
MAGLVARRQADQAVDVSRLRGAAARAWMRALGDRPIRDVRTREISEFLRALDAEG